MKKVNIKPSDCGSESDDISHHNEIRDSLQHDSKKENSDKKQSALWSYKATGVNIPNVFCALVSSAVYGFCLGTTSIMYWHYDTTHNIDRTNYTLCMVALCVLDLLASLVSPIYVARCGYGKVSIFLDVFRTIAMGFLSTYYFDDNLIKLPHGMFAFVSGSTCLCCPFFLLGSTKIDAWLSLKAPEYRLVANFVPIFVAATTYGLSNVIIAVSTPSQNFVIVFCFLASLTFLECYLYFVKGFFREKKLIAYSISTAVANLKTFFTPELFIKAMAADGVLATSWCVFAYIFPIFRASRNVSLEEVSMHSLLWGTPSCSLGAFSVAIFLVWANWGVVKERKLLKNLMYQHVALSWLGAICYATSMILFHDSDMRVQFIWSSFWLGIAFATPNSMIMILSIPQDLAVSYTGFAQISFALIYYFVDIWMNYYGGNWNENYSLGFGYIFIGISLLNLIPLTAWSIYERHFMTEERSFRSTWIRKKTIEEFHQKKSLELSAARYSAVGAFRGSFAVVDKNDMSDDMRDSARKSAMFAFRGSNLVMETILEQEDLSEE